MKADPESGAQSNMADVLIRRGGRQGCTFIERGHGWASSFSLLPTHQDFTVPSPTSWGLFSTSPPIHRIPNRALVALPHEASYWLQPEPGFSLRQFWFTPSVSQVPVLSLEQSRKWQPTPVFLPGESQGRGSLVGCCLWGRTESMRCHLWACTESDTTEAT